MIFQSRVHSAVMTHVKQKIKAADAALARSLAQHKTDYKIELKRAKQILEQKKNTSLQQAVESVLNSLK